MRKVWLAESPLVLAVAVGLGLWVLLQLLQQMVWVLVLVLVAFILAAAMMPIVDLMRQRQWPPNGWRIPEAMAVVIIYLVVAVTVSLLAFVVGQILVAEMAAVIDALPELFTWIAGVLEGVEEALGIPDLVPTEEDIAGYFEDVLASLAAAVRLAGVFVEGVSTFLFQLFLVLALALFIVVESDQILNFWVGLFPVAQRDVVRRLTGEAGRKIGRWLLGQLAIAVILGVMAGLAAWALGLPFPVIIGVVTGLLDLLPVVGPTLLVIPVALLGLAQSVTMAVVAGLVFLALAEFNSHVLTPIIERVAIRISITLILIAVPTGLALYGAIGALIALPVAAALQLVFVEVVRPWMREVQGGPPEDGGQPRENEHRDEAA